MIENNHRRAGACVYVYLILRISFNEMKYVTSAPGAMMTLLFTNSHIYSPRKGFGIVYKIRRQGECVLWFEVKDALWNLVEFSGMNQASFRFSVVIHLCNLILVTVIGDLLFIRKLSGWHPWYWHLSVLHLHQSPYCRWTNSSDS